MLTFKYVLQLTAPRMKLLSSLVGIGITVPTFVVFLSGCGQPDEEMATAELIPGNASLRNAPRDSETGVLYDHGTQTTTSNEIAMGNKILNNKQRQKTIPAAKSDRTAVPREAAEVIADEDVPNNQR